jgi:hypothetical protein
MNNRQRISFDDEDYDTRPQVRNGPPTMVWTVLGLIGIVCLFAVGMFVVYTSRRINDARMEQMQAVDADAKAEASNGRPMPQPGVTKRGEALAPLVSKFGSRMQTQLTGARLESALADGDWLFTDKHFVFEVDGKQLPEDLVKALLGPDQIASRIEGNWRLEGGDHVLVLSNIRSEGKEGPAHVKLNIQLNGAQVYLGEHQYNILPANR